MKVYVVSCVTEGFAREDPLRPGVVSVHTDRYAADSVKRVYGGTAQVFEMELDHVPPGIRQDAMHLFNMVL